ncbi:family 10 glycosylhydrolase [Methylomonas koyamae]|uniref:family 10 glycosylhydrolase n=1 Tax=Methylomonas koyamae TaxID=702114 RepID=UPI002872CC33|nr:family 10 glycosylhydrolase [Methylomonas koyamae]WNB76166.1 family 10 glycosylhydrolase [Methylomonas koyamae]
MNINRLPTLNSRIFFALGTFIFGGHVFARSSFEFSVDNYSKQNFFSIAAISSIKDKKNINSVGSVEYRFTISTEDAGWYELWVEAGDWPTDLFLDNQLLGHFPLRSSVWRQEGRLRKVTNLKLDEGEHAIRFGRLYFPGLPNIRNIALKPSENYSGMVAAKVNASSMVFRKGEPFQLYLQTGQSAGTLNLNIRETQNEKIIWSTNQPATSAGETLSIPTDREGVFDLTIKHPVAGQSARTIQYVVIDTDNPNADIASSEDKQLIATIDPATSAADYYSSLPILAKGYVESGSNGAYENPVNPDYFAYTLRLPDKNGFYLVEVDYPDDENRTFTISLVDEAVNPYALDSGVVTGGSFPLSNSTKTSQLYFYARTNNPRLLFLNWHANQQIALSQIRVYKISSGLPYLMAQPSERLFGTFFEETLRFTTYFGAGPKSSEWDEIKKAADRWAEWSRFVGNNLWMQSIANYQSVMWPSKVLPGYAPAEEDRYGLIGPPSEKDPVQKDLVRLLLLTAEKNNLAFIGELNIPLIGFIRDALDLRFGGSGDSSRNTNETPWLTVSDQGKIGGKSPFDPYLNPVHPKVQEWVESIFSELAERYKDSPAFNGLAVRLMGWAFSSWQAFPSIHWGYDDFTVRLFEKETGIEVPVPETDAGRFKKRYDWLTQTQYERWVSWRCNKIFDFYKRLASILQSAKPGLKLYINAFGPDYSASDWGQYGGWRGRAAKLNKMGWSAVIKESGIDPEMFKSYPNIILSNASYYPPGVRAKGAEAASQAEVELKEIQDPSYISAAAHNDKNASESSVQFLSNYMEYDFPVINIGFNKLLRDKDKLRICGALEPPGKLVLSRYLDAMVKGNITLFTDGGVGYVLGQPNALRPFLKEYLNVPKIPMQKVANDSDVIALWYGFKSDQVYYYLVNKSDKAANVKINFSGGSESIRLASSQVDDTATISLEPYSLKSFTTVEPNSYPMRFDIVSLN